MGYRVELKEGEIYCKVCDGKGGWTETDVEEGWQSTKWCAACGGQGKIKMRKVKSKTKKKK